MDSSTIIKTVSVGWSAIELLLAFGILLTISGSAIALRFQGVTKAAFPFLLSIAFIVCLGCGAETVSALIDAPIYVDIAIWFFVFAICLLITVVVYRLCPNLKVRAVAAALGLSPLLFLPQRVAIKPVVNAGVASAPVIGKAAREFLPSLSLGRVQKYFKLVPVNANQVGWIGETVTVRHIETKLGFKQMKSKLPKNQGFDAVFKTSENGDEVYYIVEAKANTARLAPKQMTDEWILETCKKMRASKDSNLRHTSKDILLHMETGQLRKVLSQVDISNGTIKLKNLDNNARVIDVWQEDFIPETIEQALSDVVGEKQFLEIVSSAT